MLFRVIKAAKPNLDSSTSGVAAFADEYQIGSWAINEVRFATLHAIMIGTGDNNISPLDNTTREQAIALVKRSFEGFKDS